MLLRLGLSAKMCRFPPCFLTLYRKDKQKTEDRIEIVLKIGTSSESFKLPTALLGYLIM